MKELSIEEKAKRYDEALAKAAKIHRNYKGRVRAVDVVIEEVFPELKESKDERIRKVIYGWIYTQPSQFFDNGFSKEEMLTWLEKQGEQKPKFRIGDNIEPIDSCLGSPRTIYKICDGWYETNQGTLNFEFENNWRLIEQKPAWSEEDERIYMSIMYSFAHNYPLTIQQQEFVKSIKERVQLQLKQEWTEEDELIIKRIKSLLYSINENDFKDIYAWLEFLKNRVLLRSKQEWSKEDEGYYDAIIAKLEVTREDALLTDNEMDFLKSLEKRVFPKSTWNEEDEKVIHCLEYTIRHFYVDEDTIEWCCDWLKSLRPQNRWKPSEEQITWLYRAADVSDKDSRMKQVLNELLSDLKKLI